MNNASIYLDHAATTPVAEEVVDTMVSCLNTNFANPSSSHAMGKVARGAVEKARSQIAQLINAHPSEIVFTSGGTESSNLALFGYAGTLDHAPHIITSAVEHHATKYVCAELEKSGATVQYLLVDQFGQIDPRDFQDQLSEKTDLVSLVYANNEVGTILSKEIVTKENNSLLHVDACQALPWVSIDVQDLSVDMISINSSKIEGPKGVGALWVRDGVKLHSIMFGGNQESGLRAGTENVVGIAGFGAACQHLTQNREENTARIRILRNFLWDLLRENLGEAIALNGLNLDSDLRLPNNLSVQFKNISGEILQLTLSDQGVMCSTGSACSSYTTTPSHVLLAMGLSKEEASSTLRFSLGPSNTRDEIIQAAEIISQTVKSLSVLV